MDLQLKDDGVLVMGGARGIGRAVGKAFAEIVGPDCPSALRLWKAGRC